MALAKADIADHGVPAGRLDRVPEAFVTEAVRLARGRGENVVFGR